MRRQDFSFQLPEQLIAHYPPEQRSECRLLHLDGKTGDRSHRQFADVCDLLEPGDLLVFNNTRVVPARLFGRKLTGGRVEVMLERLRPGGELLAQVGSSKPLAPGSFIRILSRDSQVEDLGEGAGEGEAETEEVFVGELEVLGREDGFYTLRVAHAQTLEDLFDLAGHMPLPPYIKRKDELTDFDRYQTVYAEEAGAVAAPTAGLHFDQKLLTKLEQLGVNSAFVTLHVGAATFQPIRVDELADHQMHAEHIQVSQEVCRQVAETWAHGGRVVAVGSTSVRALESAAQSGALKPYDGDSRLFIYPGYQFLCVDAMITNFHLSESSLLMMVSAFAGKEPVLAAYHEAIEKEYMFFSYGDAMYIEAESAPLLKGSNRKLTQ
ncbi:MAG: tRNA preQ1(34) S-adenosylmethionine ribosyltransferase-isomerase QueA [Pseudomonadales bacterium]